MHQQLVKDVHMKYFQSLLNKEPVGLPQFDSMRLLIAFFAISGQDLLQCPTDKKLSKEEKLDAVDWIYSFQVIGAGVRSGFQTTCRLPKEATKYHCGHLAMTYTGLATLIVLGDDLSRLDKKSIVEGMKACQKPDGSFTAMLTGCENDMRFTYCACGISTIINDWSGIDKPRAIDYILQSISYDGGIGYGPGLESHGGSTFCAVASLSLMNELFNVLSVDQLNRLRRWCLMRQDSGFHGRPGKPSDTCYSFWVGATLQLLDFGSMADPETNRAFVLDKQNTTSGGFAKYDHYYPDLLHTYLALCGLSLIGEKDLSSMHAALNISTDAYKHLQSIHKTWQCGSY